MPHLDSALDLPTRHHHANGTASRRGSGPSSTAFHALSRQLEEIREAATSGDLECRDWLAINHSLIQAVEACRRIRQQEALTLSRADRPCR